MNITHQGLRLFNVVLPAQPQVGDPGGRDRGRVDFGTHRLSVSVNVPPITSMIVEHDAARGCLALDLRSDVVRLAPQETITVEQEIAALPL